MENKEKEELLDERNLLKNDLNELINCNGTVYIVRNSSISFGILKNLKAYISILIPFIEKEIEVIDKKLGI